MKHKYLIAAGLVGLGIYVGYKESQQVQTTGAYIAGMGAGGLIALLGALAAVAL